MIRRPTRSTHFPYTTLFRSAEKSAKSTSDFIATNWDDIAGFGGDLSTEIGSSASELAEDFFTAWEEAEEEAEEIAEAAAQAVEETVEDIIETVEDIVEEKIGRAHV